MSKADDEVLVPRITISKNIILPPEETEEYKIIKNKWLDF